MKSQNLTPTRQARELLAEKVAELLAEGMTLSDVVIQIGRSKNYVYKLFRDFPTVLKDLQENRKRSAQTELHRNLKRLAEIRDTSENHLAAVRATQGIEAMAGVSYQSTPAGISINVFGDNTNVNAISGPQMDDLIKALAKDLGPETERVVNAQFDVSRAAGEGEGGEPGGKTEGPPVADGGAESAQA